MIVGSEECPIAKLVIIITRPKFRSRLYQQWTNFGRALGVNREKIIELRQNLFHDKIDLSDVIEEILADWVGRQNEHSAYLKQIISALETLTLFEIADELQIEFALGSVNSPSRNALILQKYPTLHNAIEAIDEKGVKAHVENGASINTPNSFNQSPLHLIARQYKPWTATFCVRMITYLVEQGADVYAKDEMQKTFLHNLLLGKIPLLRDFQIAPNELHSIIEAILSKGHKKFLETGYGSEQITLLHTAIYRIELAQETIQLLQKHEIDFNAKDKSGVSLLGYAVQGKRSIEFVEQLIQAGADPSYKNPQNNQSMIHFVLKWGDFELFKLFIELDEIDVNAEDSNGNTPLHFVCAEGKYLDKLRVLLESRRAEINVQNSNGDTPLHLLCGGSVILNYNKKLEWAQLLLKYGADKKIKNGLGLIPLEIVKRQRVFTGRREFENLLMEEKFKEIALKDDHDK